jgi:GntR family transcriptional repressor for pyruvate dehydrogenase complex
VVNSRYRVKPMRTREYPGALLQTMSDAPSRPRTRALALVESLGDRIRDGRLSPGDKLPTEAAIMGTFGVSRTVVREAISKLQAAGLVATRHGVGTFVVGFGDSAPFRIPAEQFGTLRDVIAVLELRIGIETEAAALAAQRRTAGNLAEMQQALTAFAAALAEGRDALAPDFRFHVEIARATQNRHFAELMNALGAQIIPRARLQPAGPMTEERRLYLQRVNGEHESILDAIAAQDADAARAAMRTHLANSRERRRRANAEGAA